MCQVIFWVFSVQSAFKVELEVLLINLDPISLGKCFMRYICVDYFLTPGKMCVTNLFYIKKFEIHILFSQMHDEGIVTIFNDKKLLIKILFCNFVPVLRLTFQEITIFL